MSSPSLTTVNNLFGADAATAALSSLSRKRNNNNDNKNENETVPTISAVQLRHRRDQFYLIDIREAEEIVNDSNSNVNESIEDDGHNDNEKESSSSSSFLPSDITADIEVPMGKLLAKGVAEDWIQQRGIVLMCNTGYRSMIAARELSLAYQTNKVMALQQGIAGLRNPAATMIPDLVVVLATKSNAEKITLALDACAVAAQQGNTVVLALMGDGVCTFLRKGNNKDLTSPPTSYRVEETFIGDPFATCQALLTKYIATGNGVVMACTSCMQTRGIDFGSDLLDCVQPMHMTDLVRMLGQAKTNLQFM